MLQKVDIAQSDFDVLLQAYSLGPVNNRLHTNMTREIGKVTVQDQALQINQLGVE